MLYGAHLDDVSAHVPEDGVTVTAEGRTAAENETYDFVQKLLTLRADHAALRRGCLVQYPPTYGDRVYTCRRVDDNEEILVLINGHDEARHVDLTEELNHHARPTDLVDLQSGDAVSRTTDGAVEVESRGVRMLHVLPR